MSIRWLLALAICFSVALSGCATATLQPSATPTSTKPQVSPIPTRTASPGPASSLTITLDSILYAHDGSVEVISLVDGAAVLSLFESLNGFIPDGTRFETFPGYDAGLTGYRWDELFVTVSDGGAATSAAILAPAINGVSVRTQEGLGVGSTRSDAVAASALDGRDEDGDGVADYLALGSRDVPGTQSLSRPGHVGSQYFLLIMEGDSVKQITFPGNDFSDI